MAADTVKSASITSLDAAAPSLNAPLTEGLGAAGRLVNHSDFVAMSAGGLASTSSTYKMCRLPTSCILKSLVVYTKAGLDSSTGLKLNVGAYYSDSANDGTPYSLQGVLISADCFMTATAFAQSSAGSRISALTNIDANLINAPLWQQVGLSSDPGGYIDVVIAVQTIASGTAAAGNVGLLADVVN